MIVTNPIGRYRRLKGLTQKDLGEAIGASAAAISLWENGVRMPQPYRIPQLAAALGITPEQLLNTLEEARKNCQR